jgi:selenide,water dikinase
VEFGLRGGTDITGYSLLGHSAEMAAASSAGLRFHYSRIPFISGARKYAEEWTFPGGASDNRQYFGGQVRFAAGLDEASQMLLFDPQTSGGLLLAVPAGKLEALLKRAAETGQELWEVGEVVPGAGIEVF